MRGDAALLAAVTADLVTSAIRYNRGAGRVDVRVGYLDGTAVL